MIARIAVAGLGPAGPELLTRDTLELIDSGAPLFVRTTRHPAADAAAEAVSFDELYESSETLDEVYVAIQDRLIEAARRAGRIGYLVPGSPMVAERTVAGLMARAAVDAELEVEVLPAVSFVDLAWARLGIDPVATGVRHVDGHRFAVEAAGERGPLLVAQCDTRMVLSDIKLAVDEPPERPVVVLQRLGLPDEAITELDWIDLDRGVEPDHLTSLFIPELGAPVAGELMSLIELVTTLRRECPWDREQTHRSLIRHLIEETYEVVDALESVEDMTGDGYGHLEEELGDLLFQVLFHSELAQEQGQFTVADVARGIHDKLYARHPHVFGDQQADDAAWVATNWEEWKREEKGRSSIMDGIASALPSVLLALKVQKKAAGAGMGFPDRQAIHDKILEELDEVQADPSEEELGDLLFAVTALALDLGVDPELALRGTADRFRDRFRIVERLASERQVDLVAADDAAVDALWEEAKESLNAP